VVARQSTLRPRVAAPPQAGDFAHRSVSARPRVGCGYYAVSPSTTLTAS
jgi:hypothetical protein